jgi:hypothetical protein
MVIAALEVSPDYDLLGWLADRVSSEKPFLQYHALVAILLAIRGNNAKNHVAAVDVAVSKISDLADRFNGDQSRIDTLEQIKKETGRLKAR